MVTRSPELTRLIQLRKVDVRCPECGAVSAYTAMCYRCSNTDLEIVLHGSPGWTHCLGGGGGGSKPGRSRRKGQTADTGV